MICPVYVFMILVGTVEVSEPVSATSSPQWSYPRITGHGKVVNLPKAAEQPRKSTKVVIDLTRGGAPDNVNPGLEKVARYVNLYAVGGVKAEECRFVVVMHGDATGVALGDQGYQRKWKTKHNPNRTLIAQLKNAGVKLYVCGQSLTHQGHDLADVNPSVLVATSAFTALVNHQQDGHAYVPLH